MKKIFYLLSWKSCFFVLTILLFTSHITFSQTWVRKIDGFSMWSIGKDYAGNIYAGTTGSNRGIFKSTDGGETWTNMFSTGASNYLEIDCDSLNNVYVANVSNGLIYSTDGGQTFVTVPSGTFGSNNVNTVACGKNGHVFVGATNGGVWRSTDFGATFTNTALPGTTIVEIAVDKFNADRIYAGASSTTASGFFISTDGGLTFGASTNPVRVWEILQTSSNVLYTVCTNSPYPFDKSTDGGLTWGTMSNQSAAKRGATLDLVEDIYISGNGGVFKSTDGGVTFINHNLTFSTNKILTYDYKIMVCATGTTNGGVWIYTDSLLIPVELSGFTATAKNGDIELHWTTATELNNSGFELQRSVDKEEFKKIAFIPGYGTTAKPKHYTYIDKNILGLIKYRLKQIDFNGTFEFSNVLEINSIGVLSFELQQNYPNPFNPVTTISYSIPIKSQVELFIYNTLGERIKKLLNEEKEAGNYSVNFDATNLPSGIYFYRFQVYPASGGTGSFVETKKMVLLK
jgi:photosystem II stability/assembly factor-like uncharacterized protein